METDELIYSRYLLAHNEDDFRILLERHKDSLVLFLMEFVHNAEDAEELMLDAYAEVAAGSGFSGKSSFKTWLFAIGKKKALMQIRRKRFVFLTTEKPTEQAEEVTEETPELELLCKERNLQLYQALGRVNKEYRQVLTLMYFEEMSYDEIERVMGKNRKQIYNLAERGRKALKDELVRMGFDD